MHHQIAMCPMSGYRFFIGKILREVATPRSNDSEIKTNPEHRTRNALFWGEGKKRNAKMSILPRQMSKIRESPSNAHGRGFGLLGCGGKVSRDERDRCKPGSSSAVLVHKRPVCRTVCGVIAPCHEQPSAASNSENERVQISGELLGAVSGRD
jgi:hypothetical protein